MIECGTSKCVEYTGEVPDRYDSLDSWFMAECERLHKWKIVDGNLVFDSKVADPEEEWTNPPMLAGVEYRTAERWNGKPVYTMLVDFGELPNSSEKDDYTLPAGLTVISIHGYAYSSETGYCIPIAGYYSIESFGYNSKNGNLWVSTTRDNRSYHAYITVKYTKPFTPDTDDTSRLVITDDGAGNVMIYAQGNASIVDDGNGNATIVNAGTTAITDDGAGNVTIL